MIIVEYATDLPYSYDPNGHLFPRLTMRLQNPDHEEQALEVDAYLDSGAERSLFDGRFAGIVGFDLLSGPEWRFSGTSGAHITARLHRVIVSHPALGTHSIELAFSTASLSRSLIGRDIFALCQIGFREAQSRVLISPLP